MLTPPPPKNLIDTLNKTKKRTNKSPAESSLFSREADDFVVVVVVVGAIAVV